MPLYRSSYFKLFVPPHCTFGQYPIPPHRYTNAGSDVAAEPLERLLKARSGVRVPVIFMTGTRQWGHPQIGRGCSQYCLSSQAVFSQIADGGDRLG